MVKGYRCTTVLVGNKSTVSGRFIRWRNVGKFLGEGQGD